MTASDASDQPALRSRNPFARLYDFAVSPAGFFTLLFAYVVANVLLRLWISPNLGIDDVEEAIFATDWQFGYNPRQPPLYTWLLFSAIHVFGQSLLTHLIVKYAIIAGMFAAAYGAARQLLKTPQAAALATYAIVLIFNIGWGAHIGYTHSLLLALFIFATLWALVRAFGSGLALDYAILGVIVGLGFLSKYGFALFLVPLLIGCCFSAETRRGLLNWRMLLTVAIVALIVAAPVDWMLHSRISYTHTLSQVVHAGAKPSYLANIGAGLSSLILGVLTFLAPLWLVALIFVPSLRTPAEPARPWLRAMSVALVVTLVALAATVFIAQVTDFKPRYMHPILITAPLLLFLWLDHRAADPKRQRWFAGVAGAFVVIVFAGLIGQALLEPRSCSNCWLQMPLPALARELDRRGLSDGTIVAFDARIGGNLHVMLPRARVMTPDFPTANPAPTGRGQCVLVWDSRTQGAALPGQLPDFVNRHFGWRDPVGEISILTAPLLRGGGRTDSFGIMPVSGRNGDCAPV